MVRLFHVIFPECKFNAISFQVLPERPYLPHRGPPEKEEDEEAEEEEEPQEHIGARGRLRVEENNKNILRLLEILV